MKKVQITLWILLFLSFEIQSAKLFMIGGALEDDNESVFQGLMELTSKSAAMNCGDDWLTTDCPKIAVVTSGSESLEAGESVYNVDDFQKLNSLSYKNLFKKWGMSPKHVKIAIDNFEEAAHPGNEVGDENITLIKNADIVFFNGGDQSRHARAWFNDDGSDSPILSELRKRVKINQVVVAGTSAGTAIQGKTIYGEGNTFGYLRYNNLAKKEITSTTGLKDDRNGDSGDQFEYNGGMMKGFGFHPLHMAFDTHFDKRGRLGRMIVAIKEIGATLGLGVDENTALAINGETAKVFGQHSVTFASTKNTKFGKNATLFKAEGVRLFVLSDGDEINLNTLKVTSSKPIVSKPLTSKTLSSSNIFDAYQSQKLLQHLIIQEKDKNIGVYTKTKPIYEFSFLKDNLTKGYFDQTNYTVDNAIMNIVYK